MGARPPPARTGVKALGAAARRRFLAAFLAAEVAVFAFVLAEHAWPRDVPEALGWTIYFGSYPWSLPWLAASAEEPARAMAIVAAAFALNVAIASSAAGWAWTRYRRQGGLDS
jgi:hypothetical protein